MSTTPRTDTTNRLRALIVDDAPELRMLLEPLLAREGFDVRTASDGETSIDLSRTFNPDVIILDLMMPGIDGLETCRRIRMFSDAYIVMLTSKDAAVDKIIGLSMGADDYISKPFSPQELIARLRAMLRRPRVSSSFAEAATMTPTATPTNGESVKNFGDLELDLEARQIKVGGHVVDATRIEFELLATLCSRPRMVFSRTQLLEIVWGPHWYGDTHVVDVHMSNLRKKLGDRNRSARYIQTVRGIGFRLGDEITQAAS
ncbi:MAG: response regulator transcription factor [Acidimicrobiia bacterium]